MLSLIIQARPFWYEFAQLSVLIYAIFIGMAIKNMMRMALVRVINSEFQSEATE
jgi:hypothetical protein